MAKMTCLTPYQCVSLFIQFKLQHMGMYNNLEDFIEDSM